MLGAISVPELLDATVRVFNVFSVSNYLLGKSERADTGYRLPLCRCGEQLSKTVVKNDICCSSVRKRRRQTRDSRLFVAASGPDNRRTPKDAVITATFGRTARVDGSRPLNA
jgi:hypothetical protein